MFVSAASCWFVSLQLVCSCLRIDLSASLIICVNSTIRQIFVKLYHYNVNFGTTSQKIAMDKNVWQ